MPSPKQSVHGRRKFTSYDKLAEVKLMLTELEDRSVPATITWIGASGNWGDSANWSTGTVPGPSDDAVIPDLPGNPTITITAAGADVQSVTANEIVNMFGAGGIRVTQASTFTRGLNITSGSPVLRGGGTITINFESTWAGANPTIGASGVVFVEGGLELQSTQVTVEGSLTAANGGSIQQQGATSLVLNGTLATNAGGQFDSNGTAGIINPLGTGVFTNAGTFQRAGIGSITVAANFNNTGTVEVLGGSTLVVSGTVPQHTTSTLTGGTWLVEGTLDLALGPNVTTIGTNADVSLIGSSSSFAKINNLTANQGEFFVVDRNYTVGTAFANSGSLNLFGTATFSTTGFAFTQSSNPSAAFSLESGTSLFAGSASFTSGFVFGSGTINANVGGVTNGASFRPGASPGILNITGNYTQTVAGELVIEVEGTNPLTPEFDQLIVSGTATLAGKLTVLTPTGFIPDKSETFRFLTAASRVGTFGTLSFPQLNAQELFTAIPGATFYDLAGTNYVVRNTNDTGVGSLRQAITNANVAVGSDQILFNIGTGAKTITPASALPTITDEVTIDATSQPGYAGTPLIELDGTNAGAGASGFKIAGELVTIRGFAINRFQNAGIAFAAGGNDATIQGNYLGMDLSGNVAKPNAYGVRVEAFVLGPVIGGNPTIPGTEEGNLISGNTVAGILLAHDGGAVVAGNIIGLNAAGTAKRANLVGIRVSGTTNGNNIGLPDITGTARNIISGNGTGIVIEGGAFGTEVESNWIGTDITGTVSLGNSGAGIVVSSTATNTVIGGTTAAARNIISGNTGSGVRIEGLGTSGNTVIGNFVGLNAAGTAALPNETGVFIGSAASFNYIGGGNPVEANVISGNTFDGVLIQDTGTESNFVQGNVIGLNAAGTAAVGNGRAGVYIQSNATGNFVGANGDGFQEATDGNIISGNATGVFVGLNADNNVIAGNRIGTNAAGTAKLGTQTTGIQVFDSTVDNTRIGTNANVFDDEFEGNVVSGNQINITDAGTGTVIAANMVGANITGTAVIAGSNYGIILTGSNASVGATAFTSENNIVVGANVAGVNISGATATGNVVAGNYIGVLADGTTAGDNGIGVLINTGANNNTIGGTSASKRNVISKNNSIGLQLTGVGTTGNVVLGNYIGLAANGTTARGNGTSGVVISSGASNNNIGNSTASGRNVISGNAAEGILISGGAATGNEITGNFIGTNASASAAIANGTIGVNIAGGSNTIIGGTSVNAGNIISGNVSSGVSINSGATGTVVQANLIGTNLAGSAAIANGLYGVGIDNASSNTIGGTAALARNLISGNASVGVMIRGAASNNVVQGNTIGLNAGGTLDLGNAGSGVQLFGASNNTIGGTAAGAGNVISGNNGGGVTINSASATGNTVAGNFIGTNFAGTAAVGNTGNGVWVDAGANNNTIGGTTAGARNVISGNTASGVEFTGTGTSNNKVLGNYIGVAANGSTDLGNDVGVYVLGGASGNVIGGGAAGAGNVIAGNSTDVAIEDANNNRISGNRISVTATESAVIVPSFGYGIIVSESSTGTVIGTNSDGTDDAGERNIIGMASTAGILLQAGVGTPTGTIIAGNRIGLASNGTTLLNTAGVRGIWINNAANTRIGTNADGTNDAGEANVIVNGTSSAVSVLITDATGATIAGNFLGTNPAGTAGLSAGGTGVELLGTGNPITGVIIGGISAAARNIISGNSVGVNLSGTKSTGVQVQGNYIGTNAAGTAAIANGTGVVIEAGATNNTIGGTAAAARNIISGNSAEGVLVTGVGTSNNTIAGNFIGTDVTGTLGIRNINGVVIRGGATNNTVGGGTVGSRNIISGHDNNGVNGGILLSDAGTENNRVQGNSIGTDVTGNVSLFNQIGIIINASAKNNIIGTDGDGVNDATEGNVISGSNIGLYILGDSDNTVIAGNFIGTNVAGTAALGNTIGIQILNTNVTGTRIGTNADGVSDEFERNIISGNNAPGGEGIQSRGENTIVAGNYIGTDVTGLLAIPNRIGVSFGVGAINNLIGTNADGVRDDVERNIISGSAIDGVVISGVGNTNNIVAGNYIGTDKTGLVAMPNAQRGIRIDQDASGNTVGGTTAAARNVISGNTTNGILITNNASGNVVVGNYIGTDVTGLAKLGNTLSGVLINNGAENNTIGGTTAGERNIISGNTTDGVRVSGVGTTNNTVSGNFIGTDVAGTAKLGNLRGVFIDTGASGNTIGGTTAGARNIISGNTSSGVFLQGATTNNNTVVGNYIGLDVTGTLALGNAGLGVLVDGGAANNTIGGSTTTPGTGAGNVISGNLSQGVLFQNSGTANKLEGNIIGLNAAGTAVIGNVVAGVQVANSPGTIIGGTSNLESSSGGVRNVIAGNAGSNISISSGVNTGVQVQGNYVGTNLTGTVAFNIAGNGIVVLGGTGIQIGGANANEGNLIAGAGPGILVRQSSADGTIIQGNRIGTDKTGTVNLGINSQGILIDSGAKNTLVGGSTPGARNIISGSALSGIQIDGTGGSLGTTVVQGNSIGTNLTGTAAIANATGITLVNASGVAIRDNLISGNTGRGILVNGANSTGNLIQGNLIGTQVNGTSPLGNGFIGVHIVTGATGNTIGAPIGSNDAALGNVIAFNGSGLQTDQTAGVNNIVRLNKLFGSVGLNYFNGINTAPVAPSVNLAVAGITDTRFRGQVVGTPGTTVTVDFYEANPSETASRRYLGSINVTLSATGTANYDVTLPVITNPGQAIIATMSAAGLGTSLFSTPFNLLSPILVSIDAPTRAPEGTELTVTSRVTTDRLDAELTFNWIVEKVGTPGIFAFGEDASLNFTPDDNGTYRVTITVTDHVNNEVISAVAPDIIVRNVAPQPTILNRTTLAPLTAVTLNTGATLNLRGVALEPGTADQASLVYQWLVNGSLVFTGVDYNYTPTVAGDSIVTLRITDKDGGVQARPLSVTVRGALTTAILDLPTTSREGRPLTARVQVSGATDTTRLVYEWRVTKNGVLFYSQNSNATDQFPQIGFTPNDNGAYRTTLKVTDPITNATATAFFDTLVANVEPRVTTTRTTPTPALGSDVSFSAVTTDPGTNATNNDQVQVSWIVRGPNGFSTPTKFGSNFTFKPTLPGTYLVTAKGTDKDTGSTTDTQVIEVTGGTRTVNITGVPVGNLDEGTTLNLTAAVPPVAGVTFSYRWTLTRNGDAFDSGTGATFNPKLGNDGTYLLSVTALGSDFSVGTREATLNVVNIAPTARIATLPATITEGDELALTATSTDPAGREDSLTSTWSITGPGIVGVQSYTGRIFDWTVPNDGTYTVTLKSSDQKNAFTTKTISLVSLNKAPGVTILDNGTTPGNFKFRADVVEVGPMDKTTLSYQWSINGAPVSGATAKTFTTTTPGTVSVTLNDDKVAVTQKTSVSVVTTPGVFIVPAPLPGTTQSLVIATVPNVTLDGSARTTPLVLVGSTGTNTLRGGSAFNTFVAGAGNTTSIGGNAGNLFIGGGNDTSIGGAGDDKFIAHFSTVAVDAGSGGKDTIDLSGVPFGVNLNLNLNSGSPQTVNAVASPGSTLAILGSFEELIGTTKKDTLTASASSTVKGGGGGDTLIARGSNATLIGGSDAESDTLIGDASAVGVTLIGSDFKTFFELNSSNSTLVGGSGDDEIFVGPGADTAEVFGGDGVDRFQIRNADNSTLVGGQGDDRFDIVADEALIFGGDGVQTIDGIVIMADSGLDQFLFTGDNSTLIGGDGDDSFIIADGKQDFIYAGDGADSILATEGQFIFAEGGEGRDTMVLRESTNSTLVGGAGEDQIYDVNSEGALISGGENNDKLFSITENSGATLIGGAGEDTFVINPVDGLAVPDGTGALPVVPAESGTGAYAEGGPGNDNFFLGLADNSTLVGGAGEDLMIDTEASGTLILGGENKDTIIAAGNTSNSTLVGGSGDDEFLANPTVPFVINTPDGPVTINPGSSSNITLVGGTGDDEMTVGSGSGIYVQGNEGSDKIAVTNTTNATLVGGSGDDEYYIGDADGAAGVSPGSPANTLVLAGDAENSFFISGGTNSTLVGGAGDEYYETSGGTGTVAVGGAGNDEFKVLAGTTNTTLVGGSGDEEVVIEGGTGIRFEGNTGENEAFVEAGNGILIIGGENEDRFITEGGTGVTLVGGAGDDELISANPDGGMLIYGGDGNDNLIGNLTTAVTLLGGLADEVVIQPNDAGSGLALVGETGNDTIILNGGENSTLVGGSGEDIIVSDDATGTIANAGAGNDTLIVLRESTNSTLVGGSGDDEIYVFDVGAAIVSGGDGNDAFIINGEGGEFYGDNGIDTFRLGTDTATTLVGGSGEEIIVPDGTASSVVVNAGEGNDAIISESMTGSLIFGGEQNDTFDIRNGDNSTLYGLAGDDTFDIKNGTDLTALGDLSVYDFTGNDTFIITNATRFVGYGERGNDTMTVNGGTGVSLYGGSGNDIMRNNGGKNVLLAGNSDNDGLFANSIYAAQLFGGLGNDAIIHLGKSDDSLIGEEGNDSYQLAGTTVTGGITVTLDEVRKLGKEDDFQDSANFGTDGLFLGALPSAATIDLNKIAGKSARPEDRQEVVSGVGIVLFGFFDAVYGTPFNDAITGNDFDNEIFGFGGDDTIIGGGGNDTLAGGAGVNDLRGNSGSDTYRFTSATATDTITENTSDTGTDMLDFFALTQVGADLITTGVTVDLGLASQQTYGTTGKYTIVGGATAVEGARGTRFNDVLIGTTTQNRLEGGAGNDSLIGADGQDTLAGGTGDDTVLGGNQNDWYIVTPGGTTRLTDTSGTDTVDYRTAGSGITFTLAQDAGQLQTVDIYGNRVSLTGTFENLLGSSYNDVLTGNAVANDVIGLGGLDTIEGGAGNDYLQGGSTQVVYLDFVSETRPGEYSYTQDQKNSIQTRLETLYRPFGIVFTQSETDAETRSARLGGAFTSVRFNAGQAGGQSSLIDARNFDLSGFVLVNAFDYALRYLPNNISANQLDATIETVSYNIAAHELGHQLGLRHADAFGAIGTGYYNQGILNRESFPGTYAPPAGGADTPRHVISSPLSLGTPNETLLGDQTFGVRESLKLAFAQYGSAISETSAAHDKLSTAMPLTLAPLIIPNLMAPDEADYGVNGVANTFSAAAVSVTGRIDLTAGNVSQNDWYAFSGRAGQIVTLEISSRTAKRLEGSQIDSILRLFNSNGVELAMNDDDFESQDSQILDFVIPADGIYYVMVDTFTDTTVPDTDTGNYELMIYTVRAGLESGSGDVIRSGPGIKEIVTGTGPDIVVIPVDGGDTRVISTSPRTIIDATRLPNFNPINVTGPATIIGVNRTPSFTGGATTANATEGKAFTLQYTAVDPDGGTQVSYRLINAPTGAFIDPATGAFRWTAPDNGKYTFTVQALDQLATTVSRSVTITVANAAPTVSLGNTPTNLTSPEGTELGLNIVALDSAADQDAGFTYTYTVTRGNTTIASGTSKDFSFTPTNNGTYQVRITARDKDNTTTTNTTNIVVTNVAPTVTPTPATSVVSQGTSITLTAPATDPSSSDTASGFSYIWRVNGVTVLSGVNKSSYTYTPRIVGEDIVTVAVKDDVDTTTITVPVTVTNVAPTITGLTITTGATNRLEGSPISARLTFTDPGSKSVGGNESYIVRWTAVGTNGQLYTGTTTSTGSGPVDFSFTPADNGTYDIRAEVEEDRVNGASVDQLLAGTEVSNVAPSLVITSATTGNLNQPVAFTLTPTDVSTADAAANFTFLIDWDGNGSTDETVVGPVGTVVNHTFATAGTKQVKIRAIDKDGGISTVFTQTVTIAPVNFTAGVLTIYGTTGGDAIRISKNNNNAYFVMMNSEDYGPYTGVTKVIVLGGNGHDSIWADGDITIPVEFYGEAGHDFLRGGSGNDILDGGSGDDFLIATEGDDTLRGGTGNDLLWAGRGNDVLLGEGDNDLLVGNRGNDLLDGGDGNDALYSGKDSDTLRGGTGNDYLQAGSGNDIMYGDDGDDTLRGKSGDDSIYGGAGNDDIWGGGSGNDFIDGGTGLLDEIRGGSGDDTIVDPDGVVFVHAGSGNDIINIAFTLPPTNFVMPPVTIQGGGGNDIVTLTSNNPNLQLDLEGDSGDDYFTLNGVWNNAAIRGGSGYDRVKRNGTGLFDLHGIELVE